MDILGEFLGTLFLILLGNGVVASVSYKKMYANQSGKWIVITMGWGFAVMIGVFISLGLNGVAHLNPAVSMMFLVMQSITFEKFILFVLAQFGGAIVGQLILYALNWKNIREMNDYAIVRWSSCTSPNYSNFKEKGLFQNLGYEFVGTLVLLGTILALSRGENKTLSIGPLPVAFLVMSIGISLGSVTGYAINPARDLGPRLVYFVMNSLVWKSKITADWSYSFVPVISPLAAGAVIGAFGLIQ